MFNGDSHIYNSYNLLALGSIWLACRWPCTGAARRSSSAERRASGQGQPSRLAGNAAVG